MDIESHPPEPSSAWHPKVRQIIAYWSSLREGETLPARRALDPVAIKPLLPNIWMLDVQHHPFRLRSRLVGTHLAGTLGMEPTGKWVDELFPTSGATSNFLARYRRVAETGIPSRRRGPAIFSVERDVRETESIALPLAGNGVVVDVILALTVMHLADGTWR